MAASTNPPIRPEHIRDEIHELTAATAGVTLNTFLASYVLRRTTEHALLIISEAVKALPVELTDRYPGPRWADIRGIGNVLRHDYFAVDSHVLWGVLVRDLPPLGSIIDAMIGDLRSAAIR